ncbi:MAG: single-stranded-DNA-specific exonuclease RecJ [Candidatus Dormibacteraeota bacterium]|nr:single-stranded-DNA-specific exonuclease RecJ [Candidatus Dormibacteraeota bacterium]MBV9524699.1 single-stranded-DNA-specific exonuclease RecJ [Candidatus Dormibacteraeota bacterium]
MKPAPRRWRTADAAPLSGFHPVLGRVLAARGHDVRSASILLDSRAAFHDPLELPGMNEALATLREAASERRRVAVYGDYDADGVTACAMLTRTLRAGGIDVLPYIPNRMSEGYGLHGAALEELAAQGVGCVITVDCGTSSAEVVRNRPAGMRLVVTDHHLPRELAGGGLDLAPADALINPKLPGSRYPFDGLAGAGVAFKLVQALEEAGVVPAGSAGGAVGLAALGTIADMMPLAGENRTIVQRGLPSLLELPGVRALASAAGLAAPVRAADVAFGLGPRINAAGRMEDARMALELCLAETDEQASDLASGLELQNRRRQEAVAVALREAEAQVAALPDDAPAIVLGDQGWPMGIVGLVAGRLAERYARPAFVASLDPVEAKGSARSVPGVHIVRALDAASSALLRHGGHVAAAGFSLDAANFDEFRTLVSDAVAVQLNGAPRERVFAIDSDISAEEATPSLCRELAVLEPCGVGNHAPLLALRDAKVLGTSPFGGEGQHIRVVLAGAGGILEAVAFHKPGLAAHLPRGRPVDACFSIDVDTWQGQDRVRARLRDLRPAQAEAVRLSAVS